MCMAQRDEDLGSISAVSPPKIVTSLTLIVWYLQRHEMRPFHGETDKSSPSRTEKAKPRPFFSF